PLFVDETVEHVNWAAEQVGSTGRISQRTRTLEVATGRGGKWINAFIEGFLEEVHRGKTSDFFDYLNSTLGVHRRKGPYAREEILPILENEGLKSIPFTDWEGFQKEIFKDRNE